MFCLPTASLIIETSSTEGEPLPTENNQEQNSSETSKSIEPETASIEKSVESAQQSQTSQNQPNFEFVNPNSLISRQTPNEMSGSKVKRLKKNIREKGFDIEQPIEVADVDGKLIILDGHHRASAARQLGLKRVSIKRQKVPIDQEEQLLREAAEAEIYRQY